MARYWSGSNRQTGKPRFSACSIGPVVIRCSPGKLRGIAIGELHDIVFQTAEIKADAPHDAQ